MFKFANEVVRGTYLKGLNDNYSFLPPPVYKALEAILHQTLMTANETQYKYDKEEIHRPLFEPFLKPDTRFTLLQEYVKNWESKTGMQYGLEEIHINEMDGDTETLEDYEEIRSILMGCLKKRHSLLDETNVHVMVRSLQGRVKDRVKAKVGGVGRYIQFNGEAESANHQPENHPYFLPYIGFSYGIFSPLFKKIKEESSFYKFLSSKIRFEYDSKIAKRLTTEVIRQRIEKNPKGYDLLAETPIMLGLINQEFIDYLAKLNR